MEQDYLLNFNLVVASFDYFFLHFQGNHIAHSYSVTSTKRGGFSLPLCTSMYQFCLNHNHFWYMLKQSLPNDGMMKEAGGYSRRCPLVFLWSGELNTTGIECRANGRRVRKNK